MGQIHKCSVCGQSECDVNDEYFICPVCGWGYDFLQEKDPDYWGGFNDESLNQAKAEWLKNKKHTA